MSACHDKTVHGRGRGGRGGVGRGVGDGTQVKGSHMHTVRKRKGDKINNENHKEKKLYLQKPILLFTVFPLFALEKVIKADVV